MVSPEHPKAPPPAGGPAFSHFYVTGGTLRSDAPSYVERRADRELLEGLLRAEFCYVLTSRQMGKSSLMVRAAQKLRLQGTNVVVLDLTAIGQNLTPEQWYDGLLLRLGRQLRLEEELEQFWRTHERIGPVQRFVLAVHEIALVRCLGPLVIFVDEIDVVRNLPFPTDEFFAAIRECYNRRGEDPLMRRLTFCLLGVATPSDLIRDTRTTPFNIGHRIELTDFAEPEVEPLLAGLRFGRDGREDMTDAESRALLRRVLHWTGGHPYLTQRLCRAIAERNDVSDDPSKKLRSPKAIDQLCEELFLAARARERDDNLLFVRERLLRSEAERSGLLDLYLKVRRGERVPDDENSSLIGVLRLSGVVRTGRYLEVRNRIYRHVFDEAWVVGSLPEPEKRRQREAFRRGLVRGVAAGALILITVIALWLGTRRLVEARSARLALASFKQTYGSLRTYQDHAEIHQDRVMEGARVTTDGTLTLAVEKPDKLRLTADLHSEFNRIKLEVVRHGNRVWAYAPLLGLYQTWETTNSLLQTLERASQIAGGLISESGHRFALSDDVLTLLEREAPDLGYRRREVLGSHASYVFAWHRPERGRGPGGGPPGGFRRSTNGPPGSRPPWLSGQERNRGVIPTSVWISGRDGVVNQMTTDWTKSPPELPGVSGQARAAREATIKELTFTARHADIRVNEPIPESTFEFVPPPNSKEERFDSTTLWTSQPAPAVETRPDGERQSLSIPPRPAGAPAVLLDLSTNYNASLDRWWRRDRPGSDLDALPGGLQMLGGVRFDVRGLIQLAGSAEQGPRNRFPERVRDLRVGQQSRRLHFLLGAAWPSTDGTHVGSFIVHYADGEQRLIPLVYGYDIRDLRSRPGEPTDTTGLEPVWTDARPVSTRPRLYVKAWENPRPQAVIASLDFVSTRTRTAPFVVAITADEAP